jgi:hypothetical protein
MCLQVLSLNCGKWLWFHFSHVQMLSLRSLSFLNKPPTAFSSKTKSLTISQSLVHTDDASRKTRAKPSSFLSCIVHAAKKDSQQFDVDPDKAREALQALDQQLQSLAQKQISTPKTRGTLSLSLSLSLSSMFFFFFSFLFLLSWFWCK